MFARRSSSAFSVGWKWRKSAKRLERETKYVFAFCKRESFDFSFLKVFCLPCTYTTIYTHPTSAYLKFPYFSFRRRTQHRSGFIRESLKIVVISSIIWLLSLPMRLFNDMRFTKQINNSQGKGKKLRRREIIQEIANFSRLHQMRTEWTRWDIHPKKCALYIHARKKIMCDKRNEIQKNCVRRKNELWIRIG